MGRTGFIDEKTKVVFFWSHKAGCTSLFQMLSNNYDGPRAGYYRASSDWRQCVQAIRNRGFRSVIISRDPVARVISGYINKFVIHPKLGTMTDRSPMVDFVAELFDQHRVMHGITSEENRLTFNQFLAMMQHIHLTRADWNKPDVNGHWDTQVPPAMIKTGFNYDRQFDMSEISTGFADYCTDLGLKPYTEVSNATPRPNVPDADQSYLGDATPAELMATDMAPERFVTPETIKLIKRIYWPDYAMFGY